MAEAAEAAGTGAEEEADAVAVTAAAEAGATVGVTVVVVVVVTEAAKADAAEATRQRSSTPGCNLHGAQSRSSAGRVRLRLGDYRRQARRRADSPLRETQRGPPCPIATHDKSVYQGLRRRSDFLLV